MGDDKQASHVARVVNSKTIKRGGNILNDLSENDCEIRVCWEDYVDCGG